MDLQDPEQKKVLEEAIDNAITKWLDKQFATFGKWTFHGLLAAVLAGAVWLYFHSGGFKL